MVRYMIATVIVLGFFVAFTVGMMKWTNNQIDKKVGRRDDR